jgi:Arc/MetJ-type ribon-helix-helix transcriptional regulator
MSQKLISVPMNEKFIAKIDASLTKIGYSDRSSMIRDAIVEKLQKEGVEISVQLSLPPSRTGKGGRPPKEKSTANSKAKK